jgi:hypothetical protein
MSQPTSIQMLDTAIWKELGVEEVAESEAFYDALATLHSRWLLARSEYPEMRPSNFSQRSAPTLPNQNVSCEPP